MTVKYIPTREDNEVGARALYLACSEGVQFKIEKDKDTKKFNVEGRNYRIAAKSVRSWMRSQMTKKQWQKHCCNQLDAPKFDTFTDRNYYRLIVHHWIGLLERKEALEFLIQQGQKVGDKYDSVLRRFACEGKAYFLRSNSSDKHTLEKVMGGGINCDEGFETGHNSSEDEDDGGATIG